MLRTQVPGELWSAGYAIQKGYWQNKAEDEKTMFTDANGVRWLMTGDQAVMDKDGYVSIVGRIKGRLSLPVLRRRLTLFGRRHHHSRRREPPPRPHREPHPPPSRRRRLLVRPLLFLPRSANPPQHHRREGPDHGRSRGRLRPAGEL